MERLELRVRLRAVLGIDLEPPRERRRRAEELLVEVVPEAPDPLGEQDPGGDAVREEGDVGAVCAWR